MSDFKFHCPRCRQRMRCDVRLAGRRVVCPGCQQAIVIPAPPPPPPPYIRPGPDLSETPPSPPPSLPPSGA